MNFRRWMVLAFCLIAISVDGQKIIVGTFNIRYDNKGDSGNLWVDRAPIVSNLIRFHDFDLLGIQEGLINQVNDIAAALPEYARYGKGRDDGKEAGEHSAIYYKKDRFNLLKSGDFWLSETPDKPGKGWDATCCNRICSWVNLEDRITKKKFYFFNVHFDHQGVVARRESSKLILAKIASIAGQTPALLTGDLNGGRDSEWYQSLATSGLLTDASAKVKYPYANNASFNSFRTPRGTGVIDHIFMTKQFTASKWGILTDTYFGKFPSDHFPVLAVVELAK